METSRVLEARDLKGEEAAAEAERSAAAKSLRPTPSRPRPRPAGDPEPVSCLADVLESDRFGDQLKKDLLWEALHHLTIDRAGTVRLWVRV
jgi:hypothetical protein